MRGYCSECKQPCDVVVRDFGIGAYEFWGAKGFDSQEAAVSECCEAEVYGDDELSSQITLSDLEDERADYEYERWRDKQLDL